MVVIVTRPSPEGIELTDLLNNARIEAIHLPLFRIEKGKDLPLLQAQISCLQKRDYVIVVSPQITHILKQSPIKFYFPNSIRYVAVGKKSADLFSQFSHQNIDYPAEENSEGLLKLLLNTVPAAKNILILKGNGGRQLLEETLIKQKINVTSLECYCRKPIHYSAEFLESTNALPQLIVITSVDHLLQLDSMVTHAHKKKSSLIVTSCRILQQAKQLHWQKVIVTSSANNQILFKTIASLCHNETGN